VVVVAAVAGSAAAAAAADLAAAGAAAAGAVAGERKRDGTTTPRRSTMMAITGNFKLSRASGALCTAALACLLVLPASAATRRASTAAGGPRMFATPQEAARALIAAAAKNDIPTIQAIYGPQGRDLIESKEPARERERTAKFTALAQQKRRVVIDPRRRNRAILKVGNDNWPLPVPIVKRRGKWFFDAAAGRREILYRRIGENELDAISLCRGYVDAQYDYAYRKRAGFGVNQYAQRIIATPGKQDGLAWRNADGTWDGPVGENIARIIQQGYSKRTEPYHGYYFKVLKGQGPAAPMGRMNYVVKGIMIGGFALVASPAQYRVTGVKSFIVSNDGVVYQKDLGAKTLQAFQNMQLFNPDRSWHPVYTQ
jgi:hypothetical protein